MGAVMARIDLPYVQRFKDRHGKVRHYLRRPGSKRVSLPGLPGSAEFMDAYRIGLGMQKPIGQGKSVAGSLSALVAAYYTCGDYKGLAPATQQNGRLILDKFRQLRGASGVLYGDCPIRSLSPAILKALMEEMSDRPVAAANLLKWIRKLFAYAIYHDQALHDPTSGVKRPKHKVTGFRPWTDADLAKFQVFWPVGTRERLALDLLQHTAVRRSDVVLLGRQHILANGAIRFVQEKTGLELTLPITAELQASIDLVPKNQMTFLVTRFGGPFTRESFTNFMKKAAKKAGLPPNSSPHGVRKAAARGLAEGGKTAHEIAAVTGHQSLKEVERYTKSADQGRLARSALGRKENG